MVRKPPETQNKPNQAVTYDTWPLSRQAEDRYPPGNPAQSYQALLTHIHNRMVAIHNHLGPMQGSLMQIKKCEYLTDVELDLLQKAITRIGLLAWDSINQTASMITKNRIANGSSIR